MSHHSYIIFGTYAGASSRDPNHLIPFTRSSDPPYVQTIKKWRKKIPKKSNSDFFHKHKIFKHKKKT